MLPLKVVALASSPVSSLVQDTSSSSPINHAGSEELLLNVNAVDFGSKNCFVSGCGYHFSLFFSASKNASPSFFIKGNPSVS